ncbi:MAG: hypothetical protein MUE69_23775, partial [Myxococcota bacterium]|nr:hypothetical protein [Myxococcota bacterium]
MLFRVSSAVVCAMSASRMRGAHRGATRRDVGDRGVDDVDRGLRVARGVQRRGAERRATAAGAERRAAHVGDVDRDAVVRVVAHADLELDAGGRAVEERGAVELRGVRDAVDLFHQSGELLLDEDALVVADRARGGLHRELAHAAQHVA